MAKTTKSRETRPGDALVVTGHRVGESERIGEILEVVGEPGHEHYRVRWEDGRETVFYPGGDAVVRPKRRRTGSTPAR